MSGSDAGVLGADVALALAGLAASLATAALVATEPSWAAPRVGLWVGLVLGAASLDWLSVAAHLQEAQAYIAAPALAAIGCGLAARGDRPPEGRSEVALPLLGGGLVLLLGTSGLQALAASSGSWYLPLLLGEAIAVLVLAVVAESRLCAVAARSPKPILISSAAPSPSGCSQVCRKSCRISVLHMPKAQNTPASRGT